ncbi:ATP-binding protein [Planctomicrobium sp. SH668]|uniref:sensor histidine kinase n=1 Tax=Planctomicrobium sp. SH668 TaxID=3448126 RepID=UPI003F5BFEBE
MLRNRSIQWTLFFGLGFVGLLVVASTICSAIGLHAYGRTVADLELSTGKLPRRSDLTAAISRIYPPLMVDFPSEQAPREIRIQAGKIQRSNVQRVFDTVVAEVELIKRSWQTLPAELQHNSSERVAYQTLFYTVDSGLESIRGMIEGLEPTETRDVHDRNAKAIGQTAAQMTDVINGSLDPASRLSDRLREAKLAYLTQTRLAIGLGVLSVVVLFVSALGAFTRIFKPMADLLKGVRRITVGDYAFRVKVNSQCEISELASAFNEMGSRIQEDRANKEREIEERSKQLIVSERLVSAGFLASGVAHEINNPLSVIMTAAYGLDMRLDDEILSHVVESDRADIREYLGLIQSEAERCERITKKLLDFSHGREEDRNLYDVTAIVQEVTNMVGHLSRYQDRKISVNREIPLHAWVNSSEMKQVILNLVANALDATQAGGHVDISLRELPEEVEISVKDDGCGMTKEQLKKIFEPFFTTKDVGKGTGLGLAITHRIIRDHGGTLEVDSAGPNLGSRFCLRLPKTAARANAA